MSDKPIILTPLERPKLRAGFEQEWKEAMDLKLKIDSMRETSLANDRFWTRVNALVTFTAMAFVLVFALLI